MDTTDSGQDTTGPATRRGGSARAGLLGAVVGAGALVGGLVLATGGAGAQPTTAGSASGPAPAPADEVAQIDDGFVDDELLAELEQAFENYEACLIDNGLIEEGELDELVKLVEFDEGEFDEGDWDEDDWDEDDWDEVYLDSEGIVLVEDDNGSTFVEFGDGDGEVTVSKVDGEIAVTTEGDVTAETFTWDELEAEYGDEGDWDEAFEVCDDVLDDIEELEGDHVEEYGHVEEDDLDEESDDDED